MNRWINNEMNELIKRLLPTKEANKQTNKKIMK